MDFVENECRLVILTTLPRAINIQEEFMCSYLRDASFMKRRLNQRIIQALGRCNRSDDDYAVYVLADRRFATHFGSELNRASIPRNIIAEIDMAEDMSDIDINELLKVLEEFMNGIFTNFDPKYNELLSDIPEYDETKSTNDTDSDIASDEVLGWSALFASKNYVIAAQSFERCWDKALRVNSIELCAYYGWCWAKSLYLQSLQETPGARERALAVLEQSINRGGISSWFNRMRSSLNRARSEIDISLLQNDEYKIKVFQYLDELLETHGIKGNSFERWCVRMDEKLNSTKHDEFQEGLSNLGLLLGYDTKRPRYDTATDCIWRGVFGNYKEVLTFEVKIEDSDSGQIVASDIGQVHNQRSRANTQYQPHGYKIRSNIVSHLNRINSDAEASAESIRIIEKKAILELWNLLRHLLAEYRSLWSLHDFASRRNAVQATISKLPDSGWLIRVFDTDERFIDQQILLEEWST